MRAWAWIGAAMLALACGGAPERAAPAPGSPEASAPEAAAGDQPPILTEARIRPEVPQSGDPLSIVLRAYDPERRHLEYEVQWFRNGRPLSQESGLELRLDDLRRGEEVSARVVVSDGNSQVVRNLDPVRIANRAPRIESVQLLPARPTAEASLVAECVANDDDGDVYELAYSWFVNDARIEDFGEGSLAPPRFKRGDRVRVEVVASDGEESSEPAASPTLQVRNATPRIDSQPTLGVEGENRYRYQIVASDPDGDRPLRYQLVRGPEGMSVDLTGGELLWAVPETVSGAVEVEVSVSDAHGAKASQSWTLQLAWEEAPADADLEPASEGAPATTPRP
jgi:hypothetical protein